jgi:peroxiredoxin
MHLGKLAVACCVALAALSLRAEAGFRVRDSEGALHTFEEWRGHQAIVLFFVETDCPIANGYVPEMNRIREAYRARGVLFFAVQADAGAPDAAVARYAKEYRYSFPMLIDSHQVLVRMADATIVPQAAVFTPDGRRLYLGRIDNRVEDFGNQRYQATAADLRQALDAVLAGKHPPHPTTKSIGCAITRVQEATK